MFEPTKLLIVYLIGINIVSFCVYGIDKLKAKHGRWRIPEMVLVILAVVGGSIGAWMGMKLWHHKTAHNKFKYGIPLIIVAQAAFAIVASMALA